MLRIFWIKLLQKQNQKAKTCSHYRTWPWLYNSTVTQADAGACALQRSNNFTDGTVQYTVVGQGIHLLA